MDKHCGGESDSFEDDPSSPQGNVSLVKVEFPNSSTPVSREHKKFERIERNVKDAVGTLTAEEKAMLISITQKRLEIWYKDQQQETSVNNEGEQRFRRKFLSVPAAGHEVKFPHDISNAMQAFFSNTNDTSKNIRRLVRSDGSGGSHSSPLSSSSEGKTESSSLSVSLSSIASCVDLNKAFLEDPDFSDEVFVADDVVEDVSKGDSE